MSWFPNPTVTINGEDYTGRTVGRVDLSRGRDTVYASPVAGYATVELIDVAADGLGFQVGAPIGVTVDDDSANPVPVFTGFVSDWTSQVIATGGEPIVVYKVQAVGPLAKLNRRAIFFAGRAQETDGDRVAAAVNAALPAVWSEFSLTRTWDDMGGTTWETVDPGYDPSLIDAGVYELVPLATSDGGYNALQVVGEVGQSAKGLLFETADGFIGYANADRRAANATAGTFPIPFNALSVNGLSLSSSLADLTNRVFVEYGTDDFVTEQDLPSIVRFGLQESIIPTLLARQEDAEARADDILFSQSRPATELQELRINLRSITDGAYRDQLLAVNSNASITVTGLPAQLGTQTYRGFVEGVRITVSDFEAELSLLISDELLSFGSVLWAQVADNIAWEDVDAALEWADARRIT